MFVNTGYGRLYVAKGRSVSATRYSWELHNGPIPSGLSVLHKCDNPPCVRPDHLFVGTQDDNMKDMVAKGRSAHIYGIDCNSAKLTDGEFIAARCELLNGAEYKDVAEKYDIAESYACQIKTGTAARIEHLGLEPGGINRILSDEKIRSIQKRLLEGLETTKEIMAAEAVSNSCVGFVRTGRRRTKDGSDLFAVDYFTSQPKMTQDDLYRGHDVVTMYYVEMLSLAEIAVRVGVTRKAINNWMNRRGFKLRPKNGC